MQSSERQWSKWTINAVLCLDMSNSLPNDVVNASSLNVFKNRLDKHWIYQDAMYDWHADISGTGSRSNIVSYMLFIFTLVCYLRYGHRSLWLAPITSAMLCYACLEPTLVKVRNRLFVYILDISTKRPILFCVTTFVISLPSRTA